MALASLPLVGVQIQFRSLGLQNEESILVEVEMNILEVVKGAPDTKPDKQIYKAERDKKKIVGDDSLELLW